MGGRQEETGSGGKEQTLVILMQLFCKLHFDWLIHHFFTGSQMSIKETQCFYCDIMIITLHNNISQQNEM